MSETATIEAIDTGDEHTPDNVKEARALKASLLRSGGGAVITGSVRSKIERSKLAAPDDPEDILEDAAAANDDDSDANEDDQYNGALDEIQSIRAQTAGAPAGHDVLASYLDSAPAKEEVKLTGSFGKLTFKAINVSINDFGVAFIVKKDAMVFEPNIETTLVITYRGKDYNVIYAGGFFTFAKMPFTFVSFLKVSEDQ